LDLNASKKKKAAADISHKLMGFVRPSLKNFMAENKIIIIKKAEYNNCRYWIGR